MSSAHYRRILLKVSGEMLAGEQGYGIQPSILEGLAEEIADVVAMDVEVAVVIGGGNIFRGLAASARGMERASADYMGMLATVLNALALQNALEGRGVSTRVQSAIEMRQLAEGHAAEAAAALSLLARERPADELAPEALFEAAQLYDEQLENPTEAAHLYRSLTEHYPQSRLLRRAENRLQRLTSGLRTGSAALTEFLSLQQKTEEDSPARLARLQALLSSHPDFALADQALYLLGRAQLRAGQSATQTFTTLQTRFPRSEWSAHAHKAQADALLATCHKGKGGGHPATRAMCSPARKARAAMVSEGFTAAEVGRTEASQI